MIRIGEFSKLAKTTVKTLRFYDEINLFKPSFVDDNGYRYYEIEQLNILQSIIDLRCIGMPLDEIKKVLDEQNVVEILQNHLKELEEEIIANQKNIILLNNFMAKAKEGKLMNDYKAKEILLPECIVYYRHGIIPTMGQLTEFILGAGEEVKKNNPTLQCQDPEYCFVTYGAKEYKESDIELEYAEAVVGFGKESENIKFKKLAEEKAISVYHKGRYEDLGKAYAFAINWVKQNGYEITNPIRERYIDGCWNKESPNDYLTEIQIPVK